MIRWILQEDIFKENLDPLRQAILRSGALCDIIKYKPFGSGNYANFLHESEPTVVHGSLELVGQIRRENPSIIPCGWCNLEGLKCCAYYSYLGRYLVNADYTFLPLREFDRLFTGHSVFVRPDGGNKLFSGHVPNWIGRDFDYTTQFCQPETMVVCSSIKRIDEEWRFVASKDGIVTGCKYMQDGDLCIREGVNTEAYQMAEKVVKNRYGWCPDPLYTIDIARYDDDHFGLMEINSFSCSGFYVCDVDKIVEAANKQAQEDYEEIHGQ